MQNEAHVRADEGLERGPRNRINPTLLESRKAALKPWNATVPDNLEADEVFKRYLTEEHTSRIAESYGCSRAALTQWLRTNHPERWKQVQIIRALGRKEDADTLTEDARHGLDVARARAMMESARFELERLDSENYSQKQHLSVEVEHRVTVDKSLTESARSLLDQLRVAEVRHDAAQQGDIIDVVPTQQIMDSE